MFIKLVPIVSVITAALLSSGCASLPTTKQETPNVYGIAETAIAKISIVSSSGKTSRSLMTVYVDKFPFIATVNHCKNVPKAFKDAHWSESDLTKCLSTVEITERDWLDNLKLIDFKISVVTIASPGSTNSKFNVVSNKESMDESALVQISSQGVTNTYPAQATVSAKAAMPEDSNTQFDLAKALMDMSYEPWKVSLVTYK